MNTKKNIVLVLALAFVVFSCFVYIFDTSQRYAGYLRAQAAANVHEQIEPAFLHNRGGRPMTIFAQGEAIYVRDH